MCGSLGPSVNASPARTRSPSCTVTCIPLGMLYSRSSPSSVRTSDLPRALDDLAVVHDAVHLGHHRRVLRVPRLEQVHDPGQTAGDVLGLGRGARDLGHHVALAAPRAVLDHQRGVHRQEDLAQRLALLVLDQELRVPLLVLGLDDHLPGEAADLLDLFLHRHAGLDVVELHRAGRRRSGWRSCRDPIRPAVCRARPAAPSRTSSTAP